MKSFDIIFTPEGQAILHNIKGVEGPTCLEVTSPYVKEMEDRSDPAETIMLNDVIQEEETIDQYGE